MLVAVAAAAEMVARSYSRLNLGSRGAALSAVSAVAAVIAVRERSEIGITRGIDRM